MDDSYFYSDPIQDNAETSITGPSSHHVLNYPQVVPNAVLHHEISDANLAVQILNGYKSYKSLDVLKNLNLKVPAGAIYGLLGPSGCGKTTILRCIVGRLRLDSGQVTVLGAEPGKSGHGIPGPLVGYMPQEITLFNEFNIEETINFFGMLHKMKKQHVESRKEFLLEFLNLPPKNQLIKNLSGGQKRRVSMAIALLQEPRLLILDEPTVGVDPLLREKIWTHLLDISKTSGTTIIITTHYIEEARKADRVGLMRNGKLLAEHSPDFLLQKYHEPTLEEVFLKLCIRDQVNNPSSTGLANPNFEDTKESDQQVDFSDSSPPPSRNKSIMSLLAHKLRLAFRPPKMHSYKGLIYKDFILMRRTIGFLFFQLLIPFLQVSLFCLCIGREPTDLRFGIVNNETIYNVTNCNGSLLFINELSNKTFRKLYMNWSEAYYKTKKAELWGFIDLSENFTQDTLEKFIPSSPTLNGSNVNLYLDSSNQQITSIVQARVLEAYQNFLKKIVLLLPFPVNPNLLDAPVVKIPIYGDVDPQFINFMAPGIMVTIIFVLSIGLTALIFVIEKKEGLLERTAVANVNTIELITAHITMKLIIMVFQIAVLLFITIVVFEVEMKGSFLLAGALLVLQGFCGMSLGLLVSSVVREEGEALQVSVGIVFPAMLISGILWPVEGMPGWMQFISNFSPLSISAEAVRSIASRGWGFSQWTTWFGFLTVLGWSLFFDIIALVFFNSEE